MPRSDPRYELVMRELRRRIAEGEYPPGGAIPSTPKLAEEFGFSLGTIRQAITIMTALGELYGQPGVAVYVAEKPKT